MNCIICEKELTAKQIQTAKYKNKTAKYCSKSCCYSDPKRSVNISEKNRGKNVSMETRDKISKAVSKILIGNTRGSGNKGNITSQDIKNKISNSLKGHSVPQNVRDKISEGHKGKIVSEKTKQKMRDKRLSDTTKAKIANKQRLYMTSQIQERLKEGQQLFPNWNPKACDFFEEFDKDNNTQGQHARNGGEYHIKELGYWVDYINHDLKLIMEYDEPYHMLPKQKEKDVRRQKEIQEYFYEYTFKRIGEEFHAAC